MASAGISAGISAADAHRILADRSVPVARRERVALRDVAGRVLAEPLRAPEDLPPIARAVMDGYAIRSDDVQAADESSPVFLKMVGHVIMGRAWSGHLGPGEAVAIPTGGTMPSGADAVVMIEHVGSTVAGRVSVRRPVDPGRNVIHAGEDIGRGALVLPAGRRVGVREMVALAAFGVTEVSVFARPRVAILSTGSELCASEAQPRSGQIRDVNQPVLALEAGAAGAQVTRAGIVDDDPERLRARIEELLRDHDLLLLSGGSSVGQKDFTAAVLGKLSDSGLLFQGMDVRPGRPSLAARIGDKLVFGLPGVPTSALLIFAVFVRPLLWRLGGESERELWPSRRQLPLLRGVVSVGGREDYVRVALVDRDGTMWADPVPGGSAALGSVLNADGLMIVAPSQVAIEAGKTVEIMMWP